MMNTPTPRPQNLGATELGAILDESHAEFVRYAYSRLKNWDDAEDCVQVAVVKALDAGHTLRDGRAARGWFYTILRREVIDQQRERKRDARLTESYALESVIQISQYQPGEPNPCQCAHSHLPNLPENLKRVVELVDLQGETVAEAAEQLETTANNVRVRAHRARARLREHLERCCNVDTLQQAMECECIE